MKGLRLTARGETVVDVLKVICILITLASAWATFTMIEL